MAVAPPFANLLRGMTKLRIRKRKSLPVHRGQTNFDNKGTSVLNTVRLLVLARLSPVKTNPSGRRVARSKFFVPFVLSGRC